MNPQNNKIKFSPFFLAVVIFGVFALGFWTGQEYKVCEVCPPEDINFSLFWQTYHKLQEKYVDRENIDVQEFIYGAVSGMVNSLGDPYTIFFPPEDTKKFKEDIEGVFEGVGMEIGIRKGQVQVIAPLEGTPAQKAGLRAGDKIIKVDDTLIMDLTIDEVVNLIRGPKDTEVVLTIYRDEWNDTKEIGIIRGVIEIPSLEWELLEETGEADGKEGDIAYLKLYQFSKKAALDFTEAAFEILDSPAKKIIIDLRNNPGGLLAVAQSIGGWFLESGDLVAIEDFTDGRKEEYKTYGNGIFLDYKVVVLINKGSASGSEILAGALRDNRDILLIGEKSYGKGSVQELEELRGGSSLKITVAKWLTPKGQLIEGEGLEPDIKVEMTDKDYDEGRDPQLDKAIEVIKNL